MKMNKQIPPSFNRYIKFLTIVIMCFQSLTLFGQFGEPSTIIPEYSTDHTVEFVDVNVDGDLDILIGRKAPGQGLLWYENTLGTSDGWIAHSIPLVDGNLVYDLLPLDVDSDGDEDFIVVCGTGVYLFRNYSAGGEVIFTQETIDETANALTIEIADFDNNTGTVEFLTGGTSIVHYSIDINTGTTQATTLFENTIFSGEKNCLRVIDLDNDNDLDIVFGYSENSSEYIPSAQVTVYSGSTTYGWYENTGGLNFAEAETVFYSTDSQTYPLGGTATFDLADFNNDGLTDLVAKTSVYQGSYPSAILLQDINHDFSPTTYVSTISSANVQAADLDGDGDEDLLPQRIYLDNDPQWKDKLYWLSNDGVGNFTPNLIVSIPGLAYANNIVWDVDLDNDGDLDLFFSIDGNSNSNMLSGLYFIRNEGNATFTNLGRISDNIQDVSSYHTTDVDNDGDDDIILSTSIDNSIYWVENLPEDSLSNPQLILVTDSSYLFGPPVDLDQDGDEDLIGYSGASASAYEIVWFEAINGTTEYTKHTILPFTTYPSWIRQPIVEDIDNDGLNDIIFNVRDGSIFILKNTGGEIFSVPIESSTSNVSLIKGVIDLDFDDDLDILYQQYPGPNLYGVIQDDNGNFSTSLETEYITDIVINDLDNDGDDDIVGSSGGKVIAYFQEDNFFNEVQIASAYLFQLRIADLDGDGKKDIYEDRFWLRQLYSPQNFSQAQYFNSSIDQLADLDQDGDLDFYYSYNNLVWVENQINDGYWIHGNTFWDEDQNCISDGIDSINQVQAIISIEQGNNTYFTNTNQLGSYAIYVPEGGNYLVSITPQIPYWESCLDETMVTVDTSELTLDIPFTNIVDCPVMNIQVSSTAFRPCIDASFNVSFSNIGTAVAENAQIEVVPDPNLLIDSIIPPYTSMIENSYFFELGNLEYQESGSITFYVRPDCDSITFGEFICIDAYATPNEICLEENWDGSSIIGSGECVGDSIIFTLENVGTGDMDTPRDYRINIINEDIVLMIILDTFQLDAGAIKETQIPAEDAIYQIVAEQDPDMPNETDVTTLVEGCSSLPYSQIVDIALNFPDNDGNPFHEKICTEVTGSYDPNSKEALPRGYGTENFIDREWKLNYTINFQNVGNDTAFTVIVIDTLSADLDLSTLRINNSSHEFSWHLEPNRSVAFVFNNILLPDSLTNEAGSQGYVNFSIYPNAEIEFGTQINNFADIYFDFNDPIRTNTYTHTIATPIFATSMHIELCEGDDSFGFEMVSDTLVVDSVLTPEGLYLTFQHLDIVFHELTIVDTLIAVGEIFLDLEIQNDTIIEQVVQDENNCEQTVIFNVTVDFTIHTESTINPSSYHVYPNPANRNIYVEWEDDKLSPETLEVYDINGSLIRSLTSTELIHYERTKRISLNVSNWIPGMYNLKIKNEQTNSLERVIILGN